MSELKDELTLQVFEIFRSIQGEGSRTGLPCSFVRLGGCTLRCRWCDTLEAAVEGAGKPMMIGEITKAVDALGPKLVCITGGEPLIQKNTPELAATFCAAGYTVLLETNGAEDISRCGPPTVRIMDIKCPSSGMSRQINWYNLQHLNKNDEVKFVIADRNDYEYAREIIEKHGLGVKCQPLLSPLMGPFSELTPALLAEWMLWDDLPARLQMQLHKIIWPEGEPKS